MVDRKKALRVRDQQEKLLGLWEETMMQSTPGETPPPPSCIRVKLYSNDEVLLAEFGQKLVYGIRETEVLPALNIAFIASFLASFLNCRMNGLAARN